ncbi:hypothetical protein GYN07_02380 [Rhizobium leguminosarum bv. viciae 248]|uniref:hypothetical protein n=1 Tax=Rhizobium leguminosarum TaxID=384 RepID=UPI0012BBA7ED|nr:hypothetical protein [Rhizobium leguminosarum]NKM64358.1 hypothetical protein [Rhizobium leguminosarum bv. viciae]QHW23249.1 hypothetical protein GYN07_02380 [Rhizobium leguminosarum bv. viciae 248]
MLPFLKLGDQVSYRTHYEHTLCRGGIITHDGIRVFFRKQEFDHAFFESSGRRGENDVFSVERAMRMDWIVPALTDPQAKRLQGWLKKEQRHDPTRRVTVFIDGFLVVIALRIGPDGRLRAQFVTCYPADTRTQGKVSNAPYWRLEDCLNALR